MMALKAMSFSGRRKAVSLVRIDHIDHRNTLSAIAATIWSLSVDLAAHVVLAMADQHRLGDVRRRGGAASAALSSATPSGVRGSPTR